MFGSIKSYLAIAGAAAVAIFYAIFQSTKKENKILKKVVEAQEESLHIVDVTEKVSTTLHKEHIIKEASIDASIKATKDKVKDETDANNDVLDPEYIRLLNENNN